MDQVKHNELTFNLMVEASPNALILVNNLGKIVYVNSYASELFKYKKDELVGQDLEILIPNKYAKKHPSLMKMYLTNPVRRQMGENRVLNAVKKDGQEFPVEIGLNPIVTVDGTLILAAIIDITERKRLESIVQDNTERIIKQNYEMKLSELKLQESNATKDKFFSIVAHDLKNPFNAILGFTHLLSNNYESFDESVRKKMISNIHTSAETTYALLENILTWAMTQQGRIVIKKEETNLAEHVEKSISAQTINSKKKNIEIVIDILKDQVIVIDKHTMSTVIGNIVSNAIKYTHEGGSIHISSKLKHDKLKLTIKDNGVGMSQVQLEKLFKTSENNSTQGTNKEQGTGLGLILCKEFVEKNGGKIQVESEIGKGSTFIITLPK